MAKFRNPNPRPVKKPIEIEENFFSPTDDVDVTRFSKFSNRDCSRIQEVLKKNGKVTWFDVYEPYLKNRKWYDSKESVLPEEFKLIHSDPNTEMMCVLDEFDGHAYWIPKVNPKYLEKKRSWIPKCFRNLFKLFLILMVSQTVNAQGFYEPTKPMIVPFVIGTHDINERVNDNEGHDLLFEDGGYVYLPLTYYKNNGFSKGIIVVKSHTGDYFAYDRRCSRCWYDECEIGVIKMVTWITGECDNCGARVPNIIAWGSGQMDFYDFRQYGRMGPRYLDAYTVKVIRKNKHVYLWIDNAGNGVHGEWKNQPENKIIVEGYKELYGRNEGW